MCTYVVCIDRKNKYTVWVFFEFSPRLKRVTKTAGTVTIRAVGEYSMFPRLKLPELRQGQIPKNPYSYIFCSA